MSLQTQTTCKPRPRLPGRDTDGRDMTLRRHARPRDTPLCVSRRAFRSKMSSHVCLPVPPHPCSNFRGSRSWLLVPRRWLGCRAGPAPHSSVAVRNRQRRDEARAQGHRGINGRGPRVRSAARRAWEAVRSCRERPLRLRARRYGAQQGRPMDAGIDARATRDPAARASARPGSRARWRAVRSLLGVDGQRDAETGAFTWHSVDIERSPQRRNAFADADEAEPAAVRN